jgi:hypothetical protein
MGGGTVGCKGLKGENRVKKGRQKLFRLGRKKGRQIYK